MMAIAKKPRINSRQKPILPDAALLDLVQRQTFLYFWDGAHSVSGLARDRVGLLSDPKDDVVAISGSAFGVMAIIVATERNWITRESALARLSLMLINPLISISTFTRHIGEMVFGRRSGFWLGYFATAALTSGPCF